MFSFSTAGNFIKLKCPCGASELTINITRDKKFRLSVPCIVCPNSHSYALSPNIFFERDLFSFSCKFTALNICFIGKSQQVIEALRKNEQELLETFAEYDDNFDPDNMKELSDIFNWDELDDEDFDEDEWFEELFGDLDGEDEDFDLGEILGINKPPEFEIYKNDSFDVEQDDGLDLELYSGFSTHRTDEPENKKELPEIGLDNNIDAAKIKIKNYPVIMQLLSSVSQLVKDKKIFCECNSFDGRILLLDNYVRLECKNCGSGRDIKAANMSDVQYIDEIGELFLDFED
jgi:predicted RNA-binding Zn-ribbon protein involved in translation (DUF1610 family)